MSVYAAHLDLRDDICVDKFHSDAVKTLEPFDILVNAAGVSAQQAMIDHDDEPGTR